MSRIFDLQAAGRFAEADKLIAALRDKSLLGHVQAQRYLAASYKTTYGELVAWLEAYGDHADARRMHALALKKKPAKAAAPKAPTASSSVLPYSVFGGIIEPPAKPWNEALTAFPQGPICCGGQDLRDDRPHAQGVALGAVGRRILGGARQYDGAPAAQGDAVARRSGAPFAHLLRPDRPRNPSASSRISTCARRRWMPATSPPCSTCRAASAPQRCCRSATANAPNRN